MVPGHIRHVDGHAVFGGKILLSNIKKERNYISDTLVIDCNIIMFKNIVSTLRVHLPKLLMYICSYYKLIPLCKHTILNLNMRTSVNLH